MVNPRLANASQKARENGQTSGGGYGIHWPDIDEDLSTEVLLRGAPAPMCSTQNKYPDRVSIGIIIKKPGTHYGNPAFFHYFNAHAEKQFRTAVNLI